MWQAAQREKCSGCGEPIAESTDVAADGQYVAVAVVCHACAAVGKKAAAHDGPGHGRYYRAEKG